MTEVAAPATALPGQTLAEARRARGLSVTDVSAKLKLAPRQIEALEADDYSALPGALFTRGFIRSYARLLGVDPEPLLEAAGGLLPAAESRLLTPKSSNIPFPSGRGRGWPIYAAVALLALGVAAWVLLEERPRPAETEPARQPAPLPVAPVPAPAAEPAPLGRTELPLNPVPVPETPVSPSAAAPASPPAPPAPSAGTGRLRFSFVKDAWVEVRDKFGRVIFSQLSAAGTEQRVEGEPPFAIVVGNAAQVRLEYRGRPVDLAPSTKVEVARLTLE